MTEATRATAAAAHTDEACAEDAATSLLAELDLEETESNTSNKQKAGRRRARRIGGRNEIGERVYE
jgi:hypothetical protein